VDALLRRSASKQLRSRPSAHDLYATADNVENIERKNSEIPTVQIQSSYNFDEVPEIEHVQLQDVDLNQADERIAKEEKKLRKDKTQKSLLKLNAGFSDVKAQKTIPIGDRTNMVFMNTSLAKGMH
jgi:short-subunit dehydrogenase